jgi:hypothetical protein
LSYSPARLHILKELVPCNRFLGSLKIFKIWALDYAVYELPF